MKKLLTINIVVSVFILGAFFGAHNLLAASESSLTAKNLKALSQRTAQDDNRCPDGMVYVNGACVPVGSFTWTDCNYADYDADKGYDVFLCSVCKNMERYVIRGEIGRCIVDF